MRILSIQVGSSQPIEVNGKAMHTGIYKKPVAGPVYLGELGLEGDEHVNLSVHGGEARALLVFSQKAYKLWEEHVSDKRMLQPGLFGENVTLESLDESQIEVNDTFTLGETVLQATMPRFPCAIFDKRMGLPNAQKILRASGHPGVLFRVLKTGYINIDDQLIPKDKSQSGLGILEYLKMTDGRLAKADFERIKKVPGISQKHLVRLEIRMREGR